MRYALYIFNMVLSMYPLKDTFVYPHSAYCDSGMIFQILCSLFILTGYDVSKHLNLLPISIPYHRHLVDN